MTSENFTILQSKDSIHLSVMKVLKQWAESRSKDPRTKVGAAVYHPSQGGLFLGYNGFPKGLVDYQDTWLSDEKYDLVVHAEVNAANKALQSGVDVSECYLYCTHLPCKICMKNVVASLKPKIVVYESDAYSSCDESTKQFATLLCTMLNIGLYSINDVVKLKDL